MDMKRAILLCIALALAAPSISELEQPRKVKISPATVNDALLKELEDDGIYTSRALAAQYEEQMGCVIALAEQTFEETGANGHTIAQSIPSMEQIFAGIKSGASDAEAIDFSRLKQLTYMQDFKRESTGWRIVPGEMDAAAIELTISGFEVVKSGLKEDFVIIQVNPEENRLTCLSMKEYDPENGTFVVEFPDFGPFLIAQRM